MLLKIHDVCDNSNNIGKRICAHGFRLQKPFICYLDSPTKYFLALFMFHISRKISRCGFCVICMCPFAFSMHISVFVPVSFSFGFSCFEHVLLCIQFRYHIISNGFGCAMSKNENEMHE